MFNKGNQKSHQIDILTLSKAHLGEMLRVFPMC